MHYFASVTLHMLRGFIVPSLRPENAHKIYCTLYAVEVYDLLMPKSTMCAVCLRDSRLTHMHLIEQKSCTELQDYCSCSAFVSMLFLCEHDSRKCITVFRSTIYVVVLQTRITVVYTKHYKCIVERNVGGGTLAH